MLWSTWQWSLQLTSRASPISQSLASVESRARPQLTWTSSEMTKSSFYPNLPISKCTKGEAGWRRLETFATLNILASSTVNPYREFPRWKQSQWSTTLTEVTEVLCHVHHRVSFMPLLNIYISLFLAANFVPAHLTLTVNKGETVHLSMQLLGSEKRDVTWKYNGRLFEDRGMTLIIYRGQPHICWLQAFFPKSFFNRATHVFLCLVQETTITWLTGTKWSIAQLYSRWKTQLLLIKASTARATWGTPHSMGPGWGSLFEVC